MTQNVPTNEDKATKVLWRVFRAMPRTVKALAESTGRTDRKLTDKLLACYMRKARPATGGDMGHKLYVPTPLCLFIAAGSWQKHRGESAAA